MLQPPYTTSGGLNPLDILIHFENRPVILIACVVETTRQKADWRRPKTEQDKEYQRMYLDEMGIWSETFWQRMLQAFPGIEGQQLLWSYLFFVIASEDIGSVKCQLKDVLKSVGFSHVLVRCILVEAQTTANELLNLVDDSATEAGHQPSFGWDKRFTHRIVNGEDWVSAISPGHNGVS